MINKNLDLLYLEYHEIWNFIYAEKKYSEHEGYILVIVHNIQLSKTIQFRKM